MEINLGLLFKHLQGKLLSGTLDKNINGAVIDSRKIKGGELFFAFQGERTDGHLYLETAARAGAVAAVVEKDVITSLKDFPVIQVNDAKQAVQQAAKLGRQLFTYPVIAVTGSNGKTTTKDLIASVLNEFFLTHKTFANNNNDLGLPLTILNCPSSAKALVVEMGMRALGEVEFLTSIAKPKIGVITNIGISHMELLKTQENIAQAKFELIAGLPTDGIAILNGDDPWCLKMRPQHCKSFYYGFSTQSDLRCTAMKISNSGTEFTVSYDENDYQAFIPTWGRHNVANALAALAVAVSLNLPIEKALQGLTNYEASPMRLEIKQSSKGWIVLDDTYNANPVSVAASLEVLKDISENRKIAVLGEMYELGALEEQGHYEVGKKVAAEGINFLVAVGTKANFIAQGAVKAGMPAENVIHFEDNAQAVTYLHTLLQPQDTILIKGSRGMKMENIVSALI